MINIAENKKLIERIKILMEGGKPPSFATKCLIDPKTVYSILRGEIDPGSRTLKKIAKANNVTVGWLLGDSEVGGPEKYQFQVSEPLQKDGYKEGKREKYERLLWKFQHVFDFLIELHEDDSAAIRDFLERMETDFLMQDPDYRLWKYEKKAEAEERSKKRISEDNKDRLPDNRSANG